MTFIRGAYLLHPDDKYIDKLIHSGINHLLIADYYTPPPVHSSDTTMHSHGETLRIIEKYHTQAKMILVPAWFRHYQPNLIPVDQQFVTEGGRKWTATPCPTAEGYFKARHEAIYNIPHLAGVIWDIEEYEGPGVIDIFTSDEPLQCYCERCRNLSVDQQWDIHAKFWHQYYLGPYKDNISGEMPYSNPWVVRNLFNESSYWFCEKTYDESAYFDLIKLYGWKWNGNRYLNPAYGVWTEKFGENKIIPHIETVLQHDFGENFKPSGYWLYTHYQFGCGNPLSDKFFEDLKEYNKQFDHIDPTDPVDPVDPGDYGGDEMGCKYWPEVEAILEECKNEIKEICAKCNCGNGAPAHPEPVCHPEYVGKGDHPDFPDDRPTGGRSFDHHWYLNKYPDIKANDCYGVRPYAHFYHHGQSEGRKPGPPSATGTTGGPQEIIKIGPQSMFSLFRKLDGKILAGDYALRGTCRLYEIDKGGNRYREVWRGTPGESVFCTYEDNDGSIYMGTEDQAQLFKAHPGTYNFHPIHRMQNGKYHGVFAIGRVLGRLIAIGGEIWVDSRVVKTIGPHQYCKDVFEFKGKAYSVGYSFQSNHAGWYESNDAAHWNWVNKIPHERFMRGVVTPDKVYLLGMNKYDQGHYGNDAATVWVTSDMNNLQWLSTFQGYQYISNGDYDPNTGNVYVGLTRGWRSQSGGAQLVELPGKMVKFFPDSEIRGVLCADEGIYVATRTDNRVGRVYLIPYGWYEGDIEPEKIYLSYRGDHHGERIIYRGDNHGSQYKKPTTLSWYEGADLQLKSMPISDPGGDFGILDHKEGIYWRAGSAVDDHHWKGKLVVGLPYAAIAACNAMGLKKNDKKGCWLS